MDLTADLMQKMDSPEMEQFYQFVHGDTWKTRAAFQSMPCTNMNINKSNQITLGMLLVVMSKKQFQFV